MVDDTTRYLPVLSSLYSMHPSFYYKSTGDETNVICLDKLALGTSGNSFFISFVLANIDLITFSAKLKVHDVFQHCGNRYDKIL